MKKITLAILAAICSATGLAVAKPLNKFTTYYWFKADTPYTPGIIPSGVHDIDVTFYSTGSTKPSSNPCPSGRYYICLLGFTAARVTANGFHLLSSPSGQTAVTAAYTRN